MKFNEKEMAIWATQFSPDKEGMLEKKGAGRGQGIQQSQRPAASELAMQIVYIPYPTNGWLHETVYLLNK